MIQHLVWEQKLNQKHGKNIFSGSETKPYKQRYILQLRAQTSNKCLLRYHSTILDCNVLYIAT